MPSMDTPFDELSSGQAGGASRGRGRVAPAGNAPSGSLLEDYSGVSELLDFLLRVVYLCEDFRGMLPKAW